MVTKLRVKLTEHIRSRSEWWRHWTKQCGEPSCYWMAAPEKVGMTPFRHTSPLWGAIRRLSGEDSIKHDRMQCLAWELKRAEGRQKSGKPTIEWTKQGGGFAPPQFNILLLPSVFGSFPYNLALSWDRCAILITCCSATGTYRVVLTTHKGQIYLLNLEFTFWLPIHR